ncbi:MAG: gliding motility-associated C-terminal domain-containing protein [Lewinellaceae bacterium]|nr:gliding motility-associated C-terminal domain-containing protein [Saprospiraceae bacterium]MCB9339992.1 gliding motility-associated C-terminal domain-containing protein [Lewinellaceae bacterium]
MKKLAVFLTTFIFIASLNGQQDSTMAYCAAEGFWEELMKTVPGLAEKEGGLEISYRNFSKAESKGATSTVYTLPVVVHIIHNNGPENITDAQVEQGIAHLNQAFRNQGYFNPATGADVEIEFCLAERNPDGNPTNGIVRHQSPMTDMSTPYYHSQITALATWNTSEYVNIRLVREACLGGDCSAVAGYASGPGAHGQITDGIVMEASYFGTSPENTTVAVHEMGHYLGLLHTFYGGCKNNDCLSDGDRVCDTPPDNMAGFYPCSNSYNSCQTDEDDPSANNPYRSPGLGGLGDQPDMYGDYMDYIPKFCRDRFTEGQKARMRFFTETARSSLLSSKACLPPCPSNVLAIFTLDQDTINAGGAVVLTNLSQNADSYKWYINGVLASEAVDTTFSFNDEGVYTIRMEAENQLPECDPASYELTVVVICPVIAGFGYSVQGNWLLFEEQSTNADAFLWMVKDGDGTTLFTSNLASDSFDIAGLQYIQLCLLSANGYCDDQHCGYISLVGTGIEICNNSLDDDNDGYIDLFDTDCPCDNSTFQAYCPVDCEYLPDSFPEFQMGLKWVSEIIADFGNNSQNILVGDIDGDGNVEVVSTVNFYTPTPLYTECNIKIIDGSTGDTKINFTPKPNSLNSLLSMADVNLDGSAEFFEWRYDTVYCYNINGGLLWKSDKLKDYRGTLVNICDFNADGIPELYAGDEILNAQNGKKLVSGNNGGGCNYYNAFEPCVLKHSIAADLLPAPGLELAAGNTVYQVTINNTGGTVGNMMMPVNAPLPVQDGFTSVGDINGDGELDVVVVRDNRYPDGGGIWVWDPRTLTIIASDTAGKYGGVAFIGDVTGDCLPEIGMTFSYELRIYQYDGTTQLKLLYSLPTSDKSGLTGLTMFDFNQDGKQELVYRDETDLRILEGATGATLASYPMKSLTGMEYPVVADIDEDGQAEILVNGYEDENNIELRVYCFESAGAPWAPARSVWNQYGYHVTNVNDDLTIPRQEQNMAKPLEGYLDCLQPTCPAPYNAFLAQATYRTQQGCVQWPADGDISITSTMRCMGDSIEVCIYLENVDTIVYPLGFPTWCGTQPGHVYFQNGTVLDTFYIKDSTCFMLSAYALADTIFVTANDPAHPFPYGGNPPYTECDYTNNTKLLIFPIEQKTLDLGPDIVKCASEVITLNAGVGFETYLWNDATTDSIYSSSFPGPHFVEATDQCGNIYRDTVIFTIDPTDDVSLGPDVLVCPGDTLSYSLTGSYDMVQWLPAGSVNCDTCMQVAVTTDTAFLLKVVVGKGSCFSADTVAVGVAQRVDVQLDTSICEGESISFLGSTLTATGQYGFSLNGCDSFLMVNLSLFSRDTTLLQETICTGDSVFFSSTWLKDTGTYVEILTNSLGCDSLLLLELAVVPTIEAYDTLSICEGDSVSVFGQWVAGETLLDETFTSAAGCDSTQYYQVLVTPLPHMQASYSVCQGDSIFLGGEWLSGNGQYFVRIASQTDCDTILEVTLSEITPVSNMDTLIVCEGDSVNVFGQWVYDEALLDETFTSILGCDSTQYYQVLVTPLPHQQVSYNICEGDSILVEGEWLSGTGQYNVILPSLTGCDTVLEVSLSEITPLYNTDTVIICKGDSIFIFGQWLHGGGSASGTFTNTIGCDSTQTYLVVAAATVAVQLSYQLCESDSVLVGNEWLSGEGNYSVLVGSATGCDTLYEVQILETMPVFNVDTIGLCEGDSVLVFGSYVSGPGEYGQVFNSSSNCDSTQIFVVEMHPLGHTYDTLSLCEGDSVYFAGHWVSAQGVYTDTISGAPCDMIASTWVEVLPTAHSDTTVQLCPGDSILVGNFWAKETGEYPSVYPGSNGCDSVQTTLVIKLETPGPPYSEVDCENLEVTVGIEAIGGWEIFWDNGDTLFETVYQNTDTVRVAMTAEPDCSIDLAVPLPILPDLADLPQQENFAFTPGQSIGFNLNLDPEEWKVRWSPSEIFTCDTCLSTTANPIGITTVEVTYIHSSGCNYQNSFLISVEVEPSIYIPNVFSPNSDGVNDNWEVLLPEGVSRFDEVLIFGRWGGLIAQWNDIARVDWDGTFNGKPLDPDVFVYYIRYTDMQGRKVEKKGDVVILR